MKKLWIIGLVVVMTLLSGCNLYSSGKIAVTKKEQTKNEVEEKYYHLRNTPMKQSDFVLNLIQS